MPSDAVKVVVLGGGIGSRFSPDLPKQFHEVNGKPLVAHTLERLSRIPWVDEICITYPEGYRELMSDIVGKYGLVKCTKIVQGGKCGTESALFGLRSLAGYDGPVMIYAANVPICDDDVFESCMALFKEKGTAVSGEKAIYPTFQRIEGDVYRSIDRSTLYTTHVPQLYDYRKVMDVFEKCIPEGLEKFPNIPAMLCFLGEPIYFSDYHPNAIKITYRQDVEILTGYQLLDSKNNRRSHRCSPYRNPVSKATE